MKSPPYSNLVYDSATATQPSPQPKAAPRRGVRSCTRLEGESYLPEVGSSCVCRLSKNWQMPRAISRVATQLIPNHVRDFGCLALCSAALRLARERWTFKLCGSVLLCFPDSAVAREGLASKIPIQLPLAKHSSRCFMRTHGR